MYQRFGNASIRTDPPVALVDVSGECDIATTSTLTGLFNTAVAEGCRDFRVDMNRVTFCDASMIGLLVSLDRRLRADDGSLTILGTSECVQRLLHIVGLDSLLRERADLGYTTASNG
ncbi:MAG TPA: STAS domain-containing protein [Nocardioides sp.]|uniref:STAS domain-containing protein n=1 Tax=Nocardioides sp. TaxID=35761 RepID=UPI002E372BB0|nr:STAS domain-containing protein [Nocardioides sp.]HEX5089363.1 STAS domain-containing protein [Nocardioides sp.]